MQLSGYKARDAFSGSRSTKVKTSDTMNSLVITNDGAANLTFTIHGNTYTLRPGYTFDEELEPFDFIDINASDSFFGYTRRRKK